MYNPNFKVTEFDHFKLEAGLPTFVLSPKHWAEKTGAVGIISKSGRYGGTYAHRDIAFEFGAAISPTFKLYLIKEYQRYKAIESNQYNLEGDVKRLLSKANYHIQTIAPSLTDTPLAAALLSSDQKRQANAERHPLKRIGTTDDIANMAEFLLSPKASWITGQIVHVDGGISTLKV